jgi:hypothetical protein
MPEETTVVPGRTTVVPKGTALALRRGPPPYEVEQLLYQRERLFHVKRTREGQGFLSLLL